MTWEEFLDRFAMMVSRAYGTDITSRQLINVALGNAAVHLSPEGRQKVLDALQRFVNQERKEEVKCHG